MTGPHRQLREVVLGKGDYIAGGACTLPFLDQDGARRRRPMVFGEVLGIASRCDPLVAEMFSGRASDPAEWAVMWKEIGADGICLRTSGMDADEAVALVRTVCGRTCLPIAVDGDSDVLDAVACAVEDSILVLMGPDSPHGDHVPASPGIADGRRMRLVTGAFPDPEPFDTMKGLRRAALEGDGGADAPILFDATPVWNSCPGDAREASMLEAEAALTAMMCGADALIMRGPGAADMARVYGEELADL